MPKAIGTKWAILIGVNRYHESLGPLKYAVNDCRRVGEVLTHGDDGFSADHVLLVTDDQPENRRPTYANIHSWLACWLSQPKEDDTIFVYFSGHGREMGGKCYLAPGDATLQTMHVTGIPVAHVQDILARCKAKQKILVLDACHSGAGKDVAAMSGSMMDQIAAGKGIYTITSCDADELSHEWDDKKQGVFSYYLAEALSGACPADTQGRITAELLYEWVYDRVRSWAAMKRCTQTPKRFAEGTGAVVFGRARKDYQPKPEPEIAPPRPAVPVWRAGADAFASVVEGVRTARKSVAAFLKTKAGKSAVSWISVCVAVVALVVWIATDISAKNREDRRVLAEAQIAVNADKPADAIRLLASRDMLARNRAAQDQLKAAATRLQHLEAAERAAEAGDVPRVAKMAGRYPRDVEFKTAMTKALDTGEEKYTGLATGYINKGDYLAAATVCTYYDGRQAFDMMMEQARQLALGHIRKVAPKGDWEAAREATKAFPRDEELAELGNEAKAIFDRVQQLREAKQHASLGHVTDVQRILSEYPEDPEFMTLVGAAQLVLSNDIACAQAASTSGDVPTAESLAQKHAYSAVFQECLDKAIMAKRTADLVRVHSNGEVPGVLRCEVSGRPLGYSGDRRQLEDLFKSKHEQCRLCGRWALAADNSCWNREFGCCRFCGLMVFAVSAVRQSQVIRGLGELPTALTCEVSGRPLGYSGDRRQLEDLFKSKHEQCRLCGRWVFVASGEDQCWSYEGACCKFCAEAALKDRRGSVGGGSR